MGLLAFMGFGYNFVTDHARKIDEESARGKLEYVTRAMANCKRETYTPEDLATCEHKLHEGMVNENASTTSSTTRVTNHSARMFSFSW